MTRSSTWLVLACAIACGPPKPPKQLERRFAYRDRVELLQTTSGMMVLIAPDPRTNVVAVDMRFEAGAADDPDGRAGLAHLVEHLRFQLRPGGADTPPIGERLAAKAVEYNAFTSWDYTHYKTIAPSDALADVLAVEFDRLRATCNSLPPGSVEREREVVRNELRQRSRGMYGFMLRAVYPENHPYHRSIVGNDEQIASIGLGDVCNFMAKHYTANRATLVISGGVAVDEVRYLLNKLLANATAAPRAPRRRPKRVQLPDRVDVHRIDVDAPYAIATFELPSPYEPNGPVASFVLQQLAYDLLSGRRGKQHEHITGSGTLVVGGKAAPLGLAYVTVDDEKNLRRGQQYLQEHVDALRERLVKIGPPGGPEHHTMELMLAMHKNIAVAEFVSRLERLWNRGTVLADYLHFEGKAQFVVGDLQRLDAISVARVSQLAEWMLHVHHVLHLVPDESAQHRGARSPIAYSPDDAHDLLWTMPVDEADATRALEVRGSNWQQRLAKTRSFELDNGLKVVLYPDAALPVVDIRLIFGTGTSHEPADYAGIATLAAALLSPSFDDSWRDLFLLLDFFRMGGDFDHTVRPESTSYRVRGLAMYTDVYLHALDELVVDAGFGGVTSKTLKRRVERVFEDDDVRRGLRYVYAMRKAVFGAHHPFTRSPVQTRESLARIDRKALEKFKQQHYRAGNATLIVVGTYDVDLVEKHVRHWFGGWSKKGERRAPARVASMREPGVTYLGFEDDDSEQVTITVAFPSAGGVDRLFAARLVLREMLQHRLQGLSRDELAASYGVSVGYRPGVGAALLAIETAVDAERAGEVVRAIEADLDAFRGGDGLAAEFVLARRRLLRELYADEGDTASIADELSYALRHGLGLEFRDIKARYVAELTVDKIEELIAEELAADSATVVLSGPREAVEKAYTDAGVETASFVE